MEKKICVMAALSRNGVYGKNGKIPWRAPMEQAIFKGKTIRGTTLMGRKTWESLPPTHRPLPERENIVITRNVDFRAQGAKIAHSLEEAFRKAENQEVFIIGGKDLWLKGMDFADEALITIMRVDFPIDQFTVTAPELLHLDEDERWNDWVLNEICSHPSSAGDAPAFDTHHWVRV